MIVKWLKELDGRETCQSNILVRLNDELNWNCEYAQAVVDYILDMEWIKSRKLWIDDDWHEVYIYLDPTQ